MNACRPRWDEIIESDVVVLGTGVAGLSAALALHGLRVSLITKGTLQSGAASLWAQGGIAAAMAKDDATTLHTEDTLNAGAGLCNPETVDILTSAAPRVVDRMVALGTFFDRNADGQLQIGREAAHSRNRILHANGDATGAELIRALAEATRKSDHITLYEKASALECLKNADGAVSAVLVWHEAENRCVLHRARAVVLACGGSGRLFRFTTNPAQATADGLALAARLGAKLADLEFVQFHPTALDSGLDPLPLITEAIRGEGALLLNDLGERFMLKVHPDAELAPRDVVARGIFEQKQRGHKVFLDARVALGARFESRFPNVYAICRRAGIDPKSDLIPVTPAAHYHMGGVEVDAWGATSVRGLWACGEVACTGVHGANRLASNSLLEGLVFGERAAKSILEAFSSLTPTHLFEIEEIESTERAQLSRAEIQDLAKELRELMWSCVGLVRNAEKLALAEKRLSEISARLESARIEPEFSEVRNMALIARLVCVAAGIRKESRGSHFRTDFSATLAHWEKRTILSIHDSASGYKIVSKSEALSKEEPIRREVASRY